jgi:hypothetical protein
MANRFFLAAVFVLTSVNAGAASSDSEDGFSFSVGAQMSYEDNLFRLPASVEPLAGAQRSDQVQRIDAGFRSRARIGLQTFVLNLDANRNRFSNNSFLDYSGNAASARWDWQAGSNFSGAAAYSNSRTLTGFGEQRRETRDLITQRGPSLSANVRVLLDHTLGVEVSDQQSRRSDPVQKALENDTSGVAASWAYRSPSDSTFGLRARRSSTNYLNANQSAGAVTPGDYAQREFLTFASAQAGAVSRWSAEFGYAKRTYETSNARDFSGAVGRAGFEWQPTAKLDFSATLARQLIAPEDIGTAYSVSTLASLTTIWSVTQSAAVNLLTEWDRRNYKPALDALAATNRRDTIQRARVSARFDPINALRLTAGLESGKRRSTLTEQTHRYNQATLGAEFRF